MRRSDLLRVRDQSSIDAVNRFWFEELKPEDWFKKSDQRDAAIKRRFATTYDKLRENLPPSWLETPDGYVAAIIVLDQFPRNLFRGSARSFESDRRALELAKEAIARGFDAQLSPMKRWALYLPFEHSEDAADQVRCIELMTALQNPVALDWALRHKAVVDRFGRFPHRNAILGRITTEKEAEFLKEPGSSF
jgi:uncharacterized protein (DUF924 family)